MVLVIEDCNEKAFIVYLISKMRHSIINSIDENKLIRINEYINSLPQYKSRYRRYINASDIIKIAAFSLQFKKYGTTYEIGINSNKKLYGTNAKLIDICKLINYGNMDVQGYPIFTDTFYYFSTNIAAMYGRYKKGL